MILFDSKLPLLDSVTIQEVHTLCSQWISESKYHRISIPSWEEAKNKEFSNGKGSLLKLTEFQFDCTSAISYRLTQTRKTGEQWIVDILFHPNATPKYVQIQLSCRRTDGKPPAQVHPPRILSLFLESGLCDTDCGLPISNAPLHAEDYMEGCVDIMTEACSSLLPLVYISCDMESKTAVNPQILAGELYGIAHVVTETSHNTAWTMKSYTDGRNPYNQHIGIYFSDPYAYHILAPDDGIVFVDDIKHILRQFYSDRSLTQWDRLYLAQLRASTTENADLKALFQSIDEDLTEQDKLKQERDELKAEIARLKSENTSLKGQLNQKQSGKPFYHSGTETDLYEGERNDLLFYALTEARKTCIDDSRKAHLIDDLLRANPKTGYFEQLSGEIEDIFHSDKNLNQHTIAALRKLGFSLVSKEDHYKFRFCEDPRYQVTIPKTGSDYRGPENTLAEIHKKIDIL